MLVFTCFIFPLIFASIPSFSSGGGMAAGEAIETLIALGPFLHCLLMPFTWVRTHRRNAKVAAEEPPKTPELDPDAKTVIFSMKLKTCDKLAVRELASSAHPACDPRAHLFVLAIAGCLHRADLRAHRQGPVAREDDLLRHLELRGLLVPRALLPVLGGEALHQEPADRRLQDPHQGHAGRRVHALLRGGDAQLLHARSAPPHAQPRLPPSRFRFHDDAPSRCHKQASTSGAAARRPASSAGSTAASCGSASPRRASTTSSAYADPGLEPQTSR